MKILFLPLALLLSMGSSPAQAQVSIHLDLGLPVAPRLVVVAPGIQVVEAFQDEVFFHRGWYWCRRPDGWYRARSPRARFNWVEVHRVPRSLIQVPPGHYRNWHHGEMKHNEQRERREFRQERKEEKREHKQDRREERREKKEHKHSGGKDHGRHGG